MATVLNPINLFRGHLANSVATLYTVPTGSTSFTIVKEILLCNTTNTAREVTFYTLESGGSVADDRKIFTNVNIDAYSTVILEMSTVLNGAGATLRGFASAASAISATVSGVEYDA